MYQIKAVRRNDIIDLTNETFQRFTPPFPPKLIFVQSLNKCNIIDHIINCIHFLL